jgi:cobaltochelatase CobN
MAKEKVVDSATGKTWYLGKPVMENIDRLIPRLQAWINLQRKANQEKKIAILFYNHHQGKQNIGASYLNVFASLEEIFTGLAGAGYTTGKPLGEKEVKELILSGARNVGSWAPGELDAMVQAGDLVQLELAEYERWFAELPQPFRDGVIGQWGKPGDFQMMMHNGKIVIPMVRRGNMVMMPEPARGWGDDPMKLYHDTTLYPHHQYIAAYLWLKKTFGADAMIHLGTHATYEWTPGKQAGLSPSCPPEVLISNIPNLYPYIVDDVGEAIQAKRRGRGVMLSHLTPMLRQSGLYAEYGRMAELAGEIEQAEARDSVTVPKKLEELRVLAEKTGILADLAKNKSKEISDTELPQVLAHYLEEIKEQMIPYGMHTFGRHKGEDEIGEMAKAVVKWNPGENQQKAEGRIRASADLEMKNLLHGLTGRYVEPGEGNDPLRNPEAISTGRNLYGFNPAKLPSPAAWELGKKAAEQIIANHLEKHQKYPQKVAVVLWAVETLRNEGVNESTILWLMGLRPKWQKSGKVTGLEVVPGKELGRPRIDVLINASGLYRDLFPDKMQFLDEAVQLAILQTDIENLVAGNSRKLKTKLMADGLDEKQAEELSRLRIFSEESGSYGNGVSEMAGASGLWKEEREVVDVYEKRMGFAFGGGNWGQEARALLKEQLAVVDVAVHSRSSNIYGLLDNDDMFEYLGGLAMAVRHEAGQSPETLITSQQKAGQVKVEDMAATLGREMRSRYLNPKWIEGMKKEDYAGARAMSNFVEYLWGWQVTTPDKVDAARWQQIHEVYVEDKYGLALKEFFNQANPWAYQSLTARMLEAVRKGYWQADENTKRKLAAEYAVNVVEKGVACCDHTCNNPLLNQMVVSIISLPGVMSPEMVEQFKMAIEQAAQKSLAEQVAQREDLQQQLTAPSEVQGGTKAEKPQESGTTQEGKADVEGYKMEKMERTDETTEVSSSGVEWLAGLVVLAIIGLAAWGMKRVEK